MNEFYELFPLFRVFMCACVCVFLLNVILSLPRFSFIHSFIHTLFFFFLSGSNVKSQLSCSFCTQFFFCLYNFQPHICVRGDAVAAHNTFIYRIYHTPLLFLLVWFNKFCYVQFYRCHRNSQQPFASFTRARSLTHLLPYSVLILKVLCTKSPNTLA